VRTDGDGDQVLRGQMQFVWIYMVMGLFSIIMHLSNVVRPLC